MSTLDSRMDDAGGPQILNIRNYEPVPIERSDTTHDEISVRSIGAIKVPRAVAIDRGQLIIRDDIGREVFVKPVYAGPVVCGYSAGLVQRATE